MNLKKVRRAIISVFDKSNLKIILPILKKFNIKNYFSNIEKYNDKKVSLNISDNLINQKMHTLELSNWLNFLKNQD